MNVLDMVVTMFEREFAKRLFLATVVSAPGGKVTVKKLGDQYPIGQSIVVAKSYATPTIGDTVLILRVGNGYVALCALTPP